MGLFLLSLESGFFVLCSCQIDQCLISILLWYLSLSESGGKDKTMMMNMMTGAVAINGGVGVMEVRQPQVMEKAVQDAGHIAADIAENAHITLHELKEKIDAVVEKKLPSFKALMEMNPMAVARTTVNDASLTVYQNGYAVYEMDGAHTVMAVERCGDYRYDFTDDTYQVVPAETFEETEWSVRLLMEGERRMEHNRNNRTAETENVSLPMEATSTWSGWERDALTLWWSARPRSRATGSCSKRVRPAAMPPSSRTPMKAYRRWSGSSRNMMSSCWTGTRVAQDTITRSSSSFRSGT